MMAKTIQEAIVQQKFISIYQRSYLTLMFVSNQVCNAQQNYLKQFDITLTQFNALRILRGQFPAHCSINLLKERMLDKMSDVSRLVQRLKKAGYVLHKKSKEDKRNVQVKISKKGLELLEIIDKDIHIFDAPFNELEEAELNQLVALLEKLII